jgi:hypothetical protein
LNHQPIHLHLQILILRSGSTCLQLLTHTFIINQFIGTFNFEIAQTFIILQNPHPWLTLSSPLNRRNTLLLIHGQHVVHRIILVKSTQILVEIFKHFCDFGKVFIYFLNGLCKCINQFFLQGPKSK